MRMLNDLHPTDSIYYLGYILLKVIKENTSCSLESLYNAVKGVFKVRFSSFILALDWLYCLDAINYDVEGLVSLCI